jgi:hypothetical protein
METRLKLMPAAWIPSRDKDDSRQWAVEWPSGEFLRASNKTPIGALAR